MGGTITKNKVLNQFQPIFNSSKFKTNKNVNK